MWGKNKILSIILASAMVLSLVILPVSADTSDLLEQYYGDGTGSFEVGTPPDHVFFQSNRDASSVFSVDTNDKTHGTRSLVIDNRSDSGAEYRANVGIAQSDKAPIFELGNIYELSYDIKTKNPREVATARVYVGNTNQGHNTTPNSITQSDTQLASYTITDTWSKVYGYFKITEGAASPAGVTRTNRGLHLGASVSSTIAYKIDNYQIKKVDSFTASAANTTINGADATGTMVQFVFSTPVKANISSNQLVLKKNNAAVSDKLYSIVTSTDKRKLSVILQNLDADSTYTLSLLL